MYHDALMEFRKQPWKPDSPFTVWILEFKPRSSDFRGRCLHPMIHLAAPRRIFHISLVLTK